MISFELMGNFDFEKSFFSISYINFRGKKVKKKRDIYVIIDENKKCPQIKKKVNKRYHWKLNK